MTVSHPKDGWLSHNSTKKIGQRLVIGDSVSVTIHPAIPTRTDADLSQATSNNTLPSYDQATAPGSTPASAASAAAAASIAAIEA
jgi:hypothetical protein